METNKRENIITYYNYNGEVKNIAVIDDKTIKGCHGMKVKCFLKDGNEKIGYANTSFSFETNAIDLNNIRDYIVLEKAVFLGDRPYDIAFEREKIMIDNIFSIDAILYSGPRWGNAITNEFNLNRK